VQSVLADGGYAGQPFVYAVKNALNATVQTAKRSELHTFAVIPSTVWWSAPSYDWKNDAACGKIADGNSTSAGS
jgi:hypothetical protein